MQTLVFILCKMCIRTHLFTFGSDRIYLIDEDDCRQVLLNLLKCLPQIALTSTHHLTHDLRTVDQEECSRLICHCSCHERLTCSRWAEQEDTMRQLDTD